MKAWWQDWISQLKWVLLLAIVAGPAFAWWMNNEMEAVRKVAATGVEAVAEVDHAERHGRRTTKTWSVHAIWQTTTGLERDDDIDISSEFADRIIKDGGLIIETVKIKYLPSDPNADAIVVEDVDQMLADRAMFLWLGVASGIAGVFGSAAFFLHGRKKKAAAQAKEDAGKVVS